MPLVIRDGTNTARTITEIIVRDGGNVARTISEIWVRDTSNTPRLVYSLSPPMSAACSPTDVFGAEFGSGTAVTDSTTATPTGGTGPYTYAWTVVSFDAGVSPTVNSPTAASTEFTQTGLGPGDAFFAVFRCTVTDSLSVTATADVNATFYSIGP